MIRLLLPLVLALVGIIAGVGAGLAFRPASQDSEQVDPQQEPVAKNTEQGGEANSPVADTKKDYIKLNNQFVVPIVDGERVTSMVVMSLGLELANSDREKVFSVEPKLRDVLLRAMFDHANMGGFDGDFTEVNRLDTLRDALSSAARQVLGPDLVEVLILDIARQDL